MRLMIHGTPVTKKNSQRIVKLGNGRYSIRPSEVFEAYQKVYTGNDAQVP